MIRQYDINPVPKPRMTRRDKWKKRPCVLEYFAFCDEVRAKGVALPLGGAHVTFILPMPPSWSKKKRLEMFNRPHDQKPDWDNLGKALCDAVYKDDSKIWDMRVTKYWGHSGAIIIEEV